eukprot:COSAG01_NODE_1441_length_10293_cov_4.232392_3_plen_71_part_00
MTFDDPTHGHDDTAMINGVVNKVVARLGKQLAKTLKEDVEIDRQEVVKLAKMEAKIDRLEGMISRLIKDK